MLSVTSAANLFVPTVVLPVATLVSPSYSVTGMSLSSLLDASKYICVLDENFALVIFSNAIIASSKSVYASVSLRTKYTSAWLFSSNAADKSIIISGRFSLSYLVFQSPLSAFLITTKNPSFVPLLSLAAVAVSNVISIVCAALPSFLNCSSGRAVALIFHSADVPPTVHTQPASVSYSCAGSYT